jgi:plastocyanin
MPATEPHKGAYEPGQYNPHLEGAVFSDPPKQASPSYKAMPAVVFVVFLVVVAIGAYTFSPKNKPNSSSTVSAANLAPAQVSISNSGFTPATISVAAGQAVTWMNTDNAPHTVSSDPYPTDNTLANFNSKQDLSTNDRFSFVFSKPGTFTYHDDNNPYSTQGTVIVK